MWVQISLIRAANISFNEPTVISVVRNGEANVTNRNVGNGL